MDTAAPGRPEPVEISNLVGGRWVAGTTSVEDVNPAEPAEIVAIAAIADDETLLAAPQTARKALFDWAKTTGIERADLLLRAASVLLDRGDGIAVELSREEGKNITEARAEVIRTVAILRYFAGRAHEPEGSVYGSRQPGIRISTLRQPLGVVALITPWNFPLAIPAWKIAPALVSGNTIVWKPATATPLMAFRLAEAFVDAGLPDGVLNLTVASGSAVEHAWLGTRSVDGLSFTGSEPVGRRIQGLATSLGVKVQLELGGKNAVVVAADADVELAAGAIIGGAMANAGQKCTATSRVIVVDRVADRLGEVIDRGMRAERVGDPLDPSILIGPVIDDASRRRITRLVRLAVEGGARVRVELPVSGRGFYARPTVLDNLALDDLITNEEIFGPVLTIQRVRDMREAMLVHNSVRFGLSGSIFTRDLNVADLFARTAQVGVVHVNGPTAGLEPHVPFGGMKASSSWSREMGHASTDFFTQEKTIYLEHMEPSGLFDFGRDP